MGFWESKEEIMEKRISGLKGFRVERNSVLFGLDKGVLRIKVLLPNCIRVTFNTGKEFLNIPSFAVVHEPADAGFSVTGTEDAVRLETEEMKICVDKENGGITVYDLEGKVIAGDTGAGFYWTKETVKCRKGMSRGQHFYGLGEKTGFLDKRGRKYMMWNTDEFMHTPSKDPLYKSIPFMLAFDGNRTYGIFVDSTCKSWFDLGEESNDQYTLEVRDSEMDYYFIYGPQMGRVISTYTALTGRMELPPLWALGYQQCRWGYYPEPVVWGLADSFRERDIPCDVIYLDIDYMEGYRVFSWNEDRFSDPEGLMRDLREKGFKVVTIVDPGVKKDPEYDMYMEGVRKGLFCKQAAGEVYHGKVWPGDSAYPDFTKEETRHWWGERQGRLLDKGVSGIWNDMNEPSDFAPDAGGDRTLATVPDDVLMENDGHPRTFARYHNIYGFSMCRASWEGFKRLKPEQRPFLVTRAAYAGIQRYSSVWTGDNHSWWEHVAASMPMHMNIGLSGVAFVGGDVGGFQENASPELFARWMQLGAFTPFFRAHSSMGTKPHEPWAFGKETEDICRKYIKLRYTLLPYSYNEFYKASQSGLPVMRPLVLAYPGDENTYNLSDQFLYGESIMVAPVYRPSTYKRCVYIPEGMWYDYWKDETYKGGTHILADAPLDTLPLYVRAGSILPSVPAVSYVGEKPAERLTLDVYPGRDGAYSLYEDDGISNRYKEGEYRITRFVWTERQDGCTFEIIPEKEGYRPARTEYLLRIHARGEILEVTLKDTGEAQRVFVAP